MWIVFRKLKINSHLLVLCSSANKKSTLLYIYCNSARARVLARIFDFDCVLKNLGCQQHELARDSGGGRGNSCPGKKTF